MRQQPAFYDNGMGPTRYPACEITSDATWLTKHFGRTTLWKYLRVNLKNKRYATTWMLRELSPIPNLHLDTGQAKKGLSGKR